MPTDLIRYDLLVQEALKGVVRKVLTEAARDGLPGDHHFFITFKTHAPGVRLSQMMREKYPHEITIILQHQFWDLTVGETAFEVGLSFHNVPERLVIPFDALTGFFDPSVQFGLKFEVEDVAPETGANDAAPNFDESLKLVKPVELKAGSPPALAPPAETANRADAGQSAAVGAPETKVISIDAFRKKP